MSLEHVQLLLVEDNPGDARLVREALRDAQTFDADGPPYALSIVMRVQDALTALSVGGIDLVLLDLGLPDSEGYSTFERVHKHAPDVPIVVLTRRDDDSVGLRAMREGAQDYLTKAQFDAASLVRSLRYARERKEAERDRMRLASAEVARAQAEASEARLRALAETVPQIVWRTSPTGKAEYFNRRWYDYTGLTEEQSLARGGDNRIHPEDAPRSAERWRAALADQTRHEVELRLRGREGAYRWFIVRAEPMRDGAGRVQSWYGTYTDIDDHKRAERALRLLAQVGAAMLAPVDTGLTFQRTASTLVPEFADCCLLYTQAPEGVRLGWVSHVDSAREAEVRAREERAPSAADSAGGPLRVMRSGLAEIMDLRTPRATPNPSPFATLLAALHAVSAISVPLVALGRTLGAMVLVSGQSGRALTREDLPLAEEVGRRVAMGLESARLYEVSERERHRAEQASRAKDEFLSVASHELRTPLNAILGWAHMLRTGALSEGKIPRALETIERNAKVQVQLIDDILDVNRIMTGKLRLELSSVDVAQVVEAALDVVRPAAEAKSVRLTVDLGDALGEVRGDAARLQQIVWNLMSNAVKFTPKGGSVVVRAVCDAEQLEVSVSDDGLGIEPSFLPHVFEPFRQADGTSTRSHGGLGLGLAIVKHLVELHGGAIVAHSSGRGRGATFSVQIPTDGKRASLPPPSGTGFATAVSPSSEPPLPTIAGRRVMVVDDQPDALELLRSVLEASGAEVSALGSAKEAFAAFRASPPEVLVSDIAMPEEDGYALMRWVRALPDLEGGRTPAIALTAFARTEDRQRALSAGFGEHLTKPVEPRALVIAIANALSRTAS